MGKEPILSENIRIRHPQYFSVGEYSIIDDFSYFSTKVRVGNYSHIASGCSIAGGPERQFVLGNYCSLSSGVKIWCASDDFVNDVVMILPAGVEKEGVIKDHFIAGDVTLGDYTAVGANSVVMPYNHIPEGAVIGALSFVPPKFPFKAWEVYAGIPIRRIKKRNKQNVLRQVEIVRERMRTLESAKKGAKV